MLRSVEAQEGCQRHILHNSVNSSALLNVYLEMDFDYMIENIDIDD